MDNLWIRLRPINLALAAIGVVLFGGLLFYASQGQESFNARTQDFAIRMVDAKLDETLGEAADSDAASRVSEFAGRYSERLQDRVEAGRDTLREGRAEMIADILAAACRLDCERRDQIAGSIRARMEAAILRDSATLDRMEALVVGRYDAVMAGLRGDLRIFSATTGLAFLFVLVLSAVKAPQFSRVLTPIGLVLSVATLLSAAWYVFGQDWVLVLVTNNFVGWGYAAGLGVVFAILADIAFNKGRIIEFVLNGIGNAIGNGFAFVPC